MTTPALLQEELKTAAGETFKAVLDDETCNFLFSNGNGGPDPQKAAMVLNLLVAYSVQLMADTASSGTRKRPLADARAAIASAISLGFVSKDAASDDLLKEFDSTEALAEHYTKKLVDGMTPKVQRIQRVLLGTGQQH